MTNNINGPFEIYESLVEDRGRRSGLMVSVLDSGTSGPGSGPG